MLDNTEIMVIITILKVNVALLVLVALHLLFNHWLTLAKQTRVWWSDFYSLGRVVIPSNGTKLVCYALGKLRMYRYF